MNQRKTRGTSKYKGVCYYKRTNKWKARIKKDRKTYNLGYFHEETAAAQAYNIMARQLFEDFAHFNEIQTGV